MRPSPSANAPASQKTAETTNQVRIRSARARSGVPGPAAPNARNVWRPTWIVTYAPAKSSARSPNASGIAIAMTRLASITPISTSRTTNESGSSSFVTHVV